MSEPASASFAGLKFLGHSLSGIRTALSIPELQLTFDVAQGQEFLLHLKKYFITHGHLDHCAGVPYIISQKAMHNEPAPDFYMPESLVEPLHKIMKTWMQIEGHEYKYNFHPLIGDERIPINQNYFIVPFPSFHRIPSLAYTLFHRKKKLKGHLKHLSEKELVAKKQSGETLDVETETPLVTFSGDTKVDFLDSRPWVKQSKVLFIESTYIDDKRSIESARHWGHSHLDEIIPLLPSLQCEQIVFIHLSSRYSPRVVKETLAQKIPKEFQSKVHFFYS